MSAYISKIVAKKDLTLNQKIGSEMIGSVKVLFAYDRFNRKYYKCLNCHCKGELRVSSDGLIFLRPKIRRILKKYKDRTCVAEQ